MIEFFALAQECAPTVAPATLAAVVQVESGFHPYAVGVVHGRLRRQPKTKEEAVATIKALEAAGWNFSVGLGQINRSNFSKYKLSLESVFDPCENLRAGGHILENCFRSASVTRPDEQTALRAALSCYYSGNFTTGFRAEKRGGRSYVAKVLAEAGKEPKPIQVVPEITPIPEGKAKDDKPVVLKRLSQEGKQPENHPSTEGAKDTKESAAIVF